MKTRKLIAFGIVSLLSLIGFSNGMEYFTYDPGNNNIVNQDDYFCFYSSSPNCGGGTCGDLEYNHIHISLSYIPQCIQCKDYSCTFTIQSWGVSNSEIFVSTMSEQSQSFDISIYQDGDLITSSSIYESQNIYLDSNIQYYWNTPDIYLTSDCPSCPDCPTCPVVDTGSILSGYILESSIDTLYCVENGYCPVNTGSVIGSGTNWSALFINDIQHESAPLINLTIPEEFERDYTNNNDVFNLWVSGYNVDTAYIDGIITTQKTLPDKQDFNNTISGLLPLFIPGLVIIACLYFIFRFIKKVF